MKTFRNGEYPPYAILNLVESHHMVNIHHYFYMIAHAMACRPVRVQTRECMDLIQICGKYDGCTPYLLFYRFLDLFPVHIPFDDHFYVLQNNNHGVGVTTLFGKCGLLDPRHDHHRRHHQASTTNEDSPNYRHMQQLLLFKWILQDGETLPLLSLHNLQEEAIPFAQHCVEQ